MSDRGSSWVRRGSLGGGEPITIDNPEDEAAEQPLTDWVDNNNSAPGRLLPETLESNEPSDSDSDSDNDETPTAVQGIFFTPQMKPSSSYDFEEELNDPPIVHDSQTVFDLMVATASLPFFQQFPTSTRALLCREMAVGTVKRGEKVRSREEQNGKLGMRQLCS